MWKSKFYGAFVLNRRVVLHAIDATPARWRGDAGSWPLDRARNAPNTLVDFHTGADMMSSLGSDFFAGGAFFAASSAIAAIAACFEDPRYGHHSGFRV